MSASTTTGAVLAPVADLLEARFAAKTVRTGGCWFWIGGLGDDGYGRFWVPGRGTVRAHVWAWERANGPVPAGRVLMHSCDEPSCVNPAHTGPGTQAENVAQMTARGRGRGPGRRGRAAARGAAGRSLAIRDALRSGVTGDELAAVLQLGDPDRDQLTLFNNTTKETP